MKEMDYSIANVQYCDCTGCAVCYAICPSDAIQMIEDDSGFSYPSVNNDMCVACGLCKRKCHIFAENKLYDDEPLVFSGYYKTLKSISVSSSGGAANRLAEVIIREGGIVWGVDYTENFRSAEYVCINSISNLCKTRTSKYILSEPPNWKAIKKQLDDGELVMFVGLPCQCDALSSFLSKKYISLLNVSLVCHGPTSSYVLSKYMDELEAKYGKIKNLKLRCKKNGKVRPTRIYFTTDKGRKQYIPFETSSFRYAFDLLNRESCSRCASKFPNGTADIILGDFWGGKDKSSLERIQGESMIILRNNDKLEYLKKMNDSDFIIQIGSIEGADRNNPALYFSTTMNQEREAFISDIHIMSLRNAVHRSVSLQRRVKSHLYYMMRLLIPKNIWNYLKKTAK